MDSTAPSTTPLVDELTPASNVAAAATTALPPPKFDAVRFLNDRFPDEASLLLVPAYRTDLSAELDQLKSKLELAVLRQSRLAQQAVDDVTKTKLGVHELHVKVRGIRQKAEDSERKVKDVCHDITKLDRAKTNLSNTMVALSKISKFITALDQLDTFAGQRKYAEASTVLDIVNKLHDEFALTTSTASTGNSNTGSKLKQMLGEVNRIRDQLTKSVFEDLQAGLGAVVDMDDSPAAAASNGQQQFYAQHSSTPDMLRGACLVADLLSPATRKSVRKTLLNMYLQPYDRIFSSSSASSSSSATTTTNKDEFAADRRIAWISRVLNANHKQFQHMFPASWEMESSLCVHLCLHTAEHFKQILRQQQQQNGNGQVSVGPMVKCMKKMLQFEHDVEARYGAVLDETSVPVKHCITAVFQPHLPIVVSIFLQTVRDGMDNALVEELADTVSAGSSSKQTYRVYPSSSALFQSIKQTMMSMLEYSQGGVDFLNLCLGYKQILAKYSQALENRSGITPPNQPNTLLPPSLADKPLSVDQARNLCIAINTFEYMADEIPALEKQCKRKLDAKFAHQIEFETERDLFFDSAMRAVNTLAGKLVKRVNLPEMELTLWSQFRDLGDSSPYVTRINQLVVRDMLPVVHATIAPPMMFRSFCDSFASLFLRQLQQSVWRLKRVNEEGSRQLFVDLCALERMLLDVPPSPNHAYTKFVETGMRRHKMLFKILSVQQTKMNITIEDFARSLGPSASIKLFHDMLDLRGVPKQDRKAFVKQAELAGIPATNGAEDKLADEIRLQMDAAAAASAATSSSSSSSAGASNILPSFATGGGGGAGASAGASLLGTSRLFNFPTGQGVSVPPMMSTKSLQESLFGPAKRATPATPQPTKSPEPSSSKS